MNRLLLSTVLLTACVSHKTGETEDGVLVCKIALGCGIAFLALREDGAVLLRRRPDEGLLGGMLEVPSTDWQDILPPVRDAMRIAPLTADWWKVPATVQHTFTHFELELVVYRAVVPLDASLTFWADQSRCRWVPRRQLDRQALPSVMKKVLAHGLKEM